VIPPALRPSKVTGIDPYASCLFQMLSTQWRKEKRAIKTQDEVFIRNSF